MGTVWRLESFSQNRLRLGMENNGLKGERGTVYGKFFSTGGSWHSASMFFFSCRFAYFRIFSSFHPIVLTQYPSDQRDRPSPPPWRMTHRIRQLWAFVVSYIVKYAAFLLFHFIEKVRKAIWIHAQPQVVDLEDITHDLHLRAVTNAGDERFQFFGVRFWSSSMMK